MTASDDPDICAADSRIRWSKLKFAFGPTRHMYIATTRLSGKPKEPVWMEGRIQTRRSLRLSPAAAALNYGQAIFEGMKAQRTPDGRIVLFRPEMNARRFQSSAERLKMPAFPVDKFIGAVESLVRQEAAYVPPYAVEGWPEDCLPGSRSLYIRPVMLGSGPMLGVQPAQAYTFYIYVSPVGVYRNAGKLIVLDETHRAPRYGTGNVKAASNYPITLQPYQQAKAMGYEDVLYLDARQDRYIEEVGSSNFFAILKDGTLVTPKLGSILPGITRDSVIRIARDLFHWTVEERDISPEEVFDDGVEAFYTGTAAVIAPVTEIHYREHDKAFAATGADSRTHCLKEKLRAIQTCQSPDPFGWVHEVAC